MRIEGWEERLIAAIERHGAMPFAWGSSDCLLMALDAAEAVTGVDPYADERGRYSSARGAALRLKRRGFDSVEEALAAVYPDVPVPMARRGDLGVVEWQGAPAAVVFIDHGAIGRGESGLVRISRSLVTRAFQVG